DGIHRGHQEIFRRVREDSRASGLDAVLITFDPHPKVVVSPDRAPHLLTSLEEKWKFIPSYFDGTVIVVRFTPELMRMSPEDFVRSFLVERIHVKKLVVGYDHAIGRARAGDISELRRLGEKFAFDVDVVEPVLLNGSPVSSSRIRTLMTGGEYQEALHMLGHEYAIYGTVERGIGLGRKLGYPTANVKYGANKLLPPEGVYSCWVELGSEDFAGMMFIGENHFNPQRRVTVEANIFDFDRDIYDQEIVVYPTHYVRGNRRFDSTEALVRQIAADKISILEIVKKGETTCP
ncbi:hypothetical protein C3F09_06000, partial [candidate division GN15 bacterium]